MAAKTKKTKKQAKEFVVARTENKTVQITFTIDWEKIEKARDQTAQELAKTITVPGFRQGKAPVAEAMKRVPEDQLIERSLSKILPQLFAKAIQEENLKPAIYPKFELLHAHSGEAWEIRATTCELPDIDVKGFTKHIKGIKLGKDASREERENAIIDTLLAKYDAQIPEMLIDEEINSRLASLLERLEKLGLSLESYLASLNKKAEELRADYADQAKKSIILDIILQNVALEEKITVDDKEVMEYLQMASGSVQNEKGFSPEQKNTIRLFLVKRKTLEYMGNLIKN